MSQPPRPIVLVIDPDPLTLMGLSSTLHHENLEVHGARTRTATLKAAEDLALDLIVVDSWIEPDQGIGLVNAIRNLPHLVDVPVVFLLEAGAARGFQFPTSAFQILKPIDLEAMIAVVKRAIWMPHLVHTQMTLRPHSFSSAPTSDSSIIL